VDRQRQHFAAPKIPNLAGAIAKSHATSPETMHHDRVYAVLFEIGLCSVVLHAAYSAQSKPSIRTFFAILVTKIGRVHHG
jgi:hypothetical protein